MSQTQDSAGVARLQYARIAPRKARLVADMVRGRPVEEALRLLAFTQKRSAPILGKLIRSAIANAQTKAPGIDVDTLVIGTVFVDGGPMMRRYTPRAHGRATRIRKRTSHITLAVDAR